MEKKITLKNLYNLTYGGEKPFESEKSLAEIYYVSTIAAMVEKQIGNPKRTSMVDIICYFLDELGIDMQDYYMYLLKELKDSNADASLFEIFHHDELFEDVYKYSDYILKKLGVNVDKQVDNLIEFKSAFVGMLLGEDLLKGIVNIAKTNNEKLKEQYLKVIEILYGNQNTKQAIKDLIAYFDSEGINKDEINERRNKILANVDNSLIVDLTAAILNPNIYSEDENQELNIESVKQMLVNLETRVVGQEVALKKVKDAILASTAGFKDENQPIASFLLTGPTGVGKTETAKAVADSIFDGKMYVVDMSTYKNQIDVSRLLGGSPNYVGYNDPNTFCEFLKANPKSVILFDEIEKGHFGCHDLLMRILDEGEFINSKGEVISLKDTVIFCTTNFTQNVKNVAGFGTGPTTEQKITSNGIGLKKELVGRFTDVIEYRQLESTACKQIAEEKFLKRAIATFEKNNGGKIKLTYDDSLLNKILADANTNLFGARDLKKAIHKNFIAVVSKYVVENDCKGKTLLVTENGVKVVKGKAKSTAKDLEIEM